MNIEILFIPESIVKVINNLTGWGFFVLSSFFIILGVIIIIIFYFKTHTHKIIEYR